MVEPERRVGLRWTDACLFAFATLAGAALIGSLSGIRVPEVHDEFAYLLLGETFASGRLTNPTPEHWHHLETYHVLMEPSYTAKYPPGQGIPIALGFLLGLPILGIWICSALMVASAAWMFGPLFPRKLAVIGGLGLMLQLGLASAWAQTFWGGALAATGGALLYGSLFRAWRKPTLGLGVLMATALMILANTRPMEGLLVSVPAGVLVLGIRAPKKAMIRFWLGLTISLAAGFAAMGAYNHAITGDPLRMPYQEYQAQYGAAPVLLTGTPRDELPAYRHEAFEQFWQSWERDRFAELRQPKDMIRTRALALVQILGRFLGFGVLGLALLRPRLDDPWVRTIALAAGLGLFGTLLSKGAYPHYLAPACPLFALLALKGWQEGLANPSPWTKRMIFAAVVGTIWVPVVQTVSRVKVGDNEIQTARAKIASCLDEANFSSLLLVEFEGPFQHRGELVRNGPDPWAQDVVWARSMGPDRDRTLSGAYPERAVWSVKVDATDPDGPSVHLDPMRPPDGGDQDWSRTTSACMQQT